MAESESRINQEYIKFKYILLKVNQVPLNSSKLPVLTYGIISDYSRCIYSVT